MNHPDVSLSKHDKDRILGLAIGDGHISKHGQLVLRHCEDQLEYLQYKVDLLKAMNLNPSNPKRYITKIKGRNKTYITYQSQCSNSSFRKIRKKLYPHGIKTVRTSILSNLTEMDLAIWYMDDGSLQRTGGSNTKNKGGKYVGSRFATDCWSETEHHIIIKAFKRKFNIDSKIHHKKGKCYLYLNMPNTIRMIAICYPYLRLVNCMKYKWQSFYINDAEQIVQKDSESLSDRELKTRLFVKYYNTNLDKHQDEELIIKYYNNIRKFEEAIKLSKNIHNK